MLASELHSPDPLAFSLFYDTYTPKVWGIILLAGLSATQSESILINTITGAWHQLEQHLPTEKQFLTRLIGLACQEGFPTHCLQTIFTSKQQAS